MTLHESVERLPCPQGLDEFLRNMLTRHCTPYFGETLDLGDIEYLLIKPMITILKPFTSTFPNPLVIHGPLTPLAHKLPGFLLSCPGS